MAEINVGIIGFGTVGAGTFEALKTNREIISARVGADVVVKRIADLDVKTDRGVPVDPGVLTTDAMEIIEDSSIDIVVELIGGLTKAKELILLALERGKHVVTANKALLAEYGKEIYAAADRVGVNLAFEASVGGGIPIIGALRRGLAANRIKTIMGILNGTSNYILTRMTREGLPYADVVSDAVRLGYAEDPPTLDVEGIDAAHKLAVLISIVFGSPFSFSEIYREGISRLTPDDIRYAADFGYGVKLLAVARDTEEGLEARVHPAMVPKNHIMANVNDVFNAIYIEGDFVGPNLFYGLGAGRRPTGSAVVSDIIEIARQIRCGAGRLMPPLAHVHAPGGALKLRPIDQLRTEYYFRVSAVDRPGVLSKIAGVLGDHEISISSVIQKGRDLRGFVPIVMVTHEALEMNVRKAMAVLDAMDVLTDKIVMVRVERG
ncbi:MAG: homoserine dehydrogenase [Deltaproteobacteria bacterium CG_4_8_14_3_um_filter_51_11]|nr:homoserine dehydrogenase [bacterium]OIP40673.1 MAG: homoserine dehydrogenase [Desulfobacteraceae bacterium CG2_30_51_40]PIP47329.1 MAG: homoserine dehydrogenase [Deltaproteobacteria bacterium CG23_combo_of_CG06-09_8_20_14_all_51_20]PIX19666.1 MAG: homoserine dehydrogenase [Deltaproteobacteria bacterium CG_4_8_14_3_um_filter_51_11]PJB34825.1 MAG: homoserine dehydrogenase [Deltaproteobacteria bacterium CG_4_9_14_3_um_filter_51_14]